MTKTTKTSKSAEPVLDLAPGLSLPLQAVTDTFAILAKRRAGKSNSAVVMAEEFYDHGLPWVAIDPKGDWWGVRASGDGNAPGLAVTVFGGRHGDLPLEPSAGALLADLVVEERITCVLDVSEMDDPDRQRFLLDFAKRLYVRNTAPLHVFCEEADDYIPQGASREELAVVRAFTRLIKQGGTRGIGVTLITQRSAMLSKNALSQAEGMIALRTTAPTDRKVISEWVSGNIDRAEIASELPGLGNGEAWVIAPHLIGEPTKVQFRRRRTFDSGATPVVGAAPVEPRRLADVDLDRIKQAMSETIEKVAAADPETLRRRIASLERDLDQARRQRVPAPGDSGAPAAEPRTVEVPVEVPAISEADLVRIEKFLETHRDSAENLVAAAESAVADLRARSEEILANLADLSAQARAARANPVSPTARTAGPASDAARVTSSVPARAARPVPPRPAAAPSTDTSAEPLSKGQRLILAALAQHGTLTTNQVATITDYSNTSGGFKNYLSQLRTAGWIDGSGTGTSSITDAGITVLGDFEPLPSGDALLEWWLARGKPLGLAERVLLGVLRSHYPEHVTSEDLAAESGYSPTSGGFKNAMSRLRTLSLAEGRGGLRLSDDLVG